MLLNISKNVTFCAKVYFQNFVMEEIKLEVLLQCF